MTKISVVSTMYHSSTYLAEFVGRVDTSSKTIADNYELILVNDGSPDDSLELALKLKKNYPQIKIIDLSRNFGHHHAIMSGLSYATGQRIFLIDCDLEESPEWMISFSEQMDREACDVVYGVQIKRKGNWLERTSGSMAYSLFNLICNIHTEPNLITCRLMTQKYVQELLKFDEREIVFSGLCYLAGFKQQSQKVTKKSTSPSTYTLKKKISTFINMITSFSSAPLIWIFNTGMLIFIVAALAAGTLIINWIFFSKPLAGWTSIIVSLWLIGGLIISFIGIIGIYLSKIFMETKQRPNTIVRKIYE